MIQRMTIYINMQILLAVLSMLNDTSWENLFKNQEVLYLVIISLLRYIFVTCMFDQEVTL